MDYKTFFKGMIMGICDVVPGISGGTIAFITGIYERLINSIKAFSPSAILNFIFLLVGKGDKQQFRSDLKNADLKFLITLFGGIAVSILLFSKVMEFLLSEYLLFVMSFFVGLILSSAITLFKHIEKHHTNNQLMAILGFIIGISLAFIVPTVVDPTPAMLFLSGAIAISAMILPGISGSFILLIIGMYETIISAISNLPSSFPTLFIFGIGAIVGLMTITRVVSYLFKKNKCMTLYTLVGLVIGALSVPLKQILSLSENLQSIELVLMFALALVGVVGASYLAKLGKK